MAGLTQEGRNPSSTAGWAITRLRFVSGGLRVQPFLIIDMSKPWNSLEAIWSHTNKGKSTRQADSWAYQLRNLLLCTDLGAACLYYLCSPKQASTSRLSAAVSPARQLGQRQLDLQHMAFGSTVYPASVSSPMALPLLPLLRSHGGLPMASWRRRTMSLLSLCAACHSTPTIEPVDWLRSCVLTGSVVTPSSPSQSCLLPSLFTPCEPSVGRTCDGRRTLLAGFAGSKRSVRRARC